MMAVILFAKILDSEQFSISYNRGEEHFYGCASRPTL